MKEIEELEHQEDELFERINQLTNLDEIGNARLRILILRIAENQIEQESLCNR